MSASAAASGDDHTELWNELIDALEQAQQALLRRDLPSFEFHTERQRICCERLGAIGEGSAPAHRSAQRRAQHLSRVHAALLRRALQSLLILRNLAGNTPHQSLTQEGRDCFRQEA
jgi:hypothetical protein